ncbi:MAG TPA: FAD-dependent oxidoreductase [Tepidisphaeraceae bacterium]|nr:FAD-dependent oxidoreductase [Tepidisphaeraceae bacterium]
MKSPDGRLKPDWYDTATIPTYPPPPAGEMRCDVCVVGAGISGLTAAYHLAKAGKSVVVLDEGPIGSGQTGRTTAHLASYCDDQFTELERLHGLPKAKLWHESNAAAIDAIERISHDEQIDCDFHRLDAYLFLAPADGVKTLNAEFDACKRVGLTDVEKIDRMHAPGFAEHGPALRIGNQGRFQPLKYLVGLAKAVERYGGRIYTGCRVKTTQGRDPTDPAAKCVAFLDQNHGTVVCDAVVAAANVPAVVEWMWIYTKQAPYRSYVVGLRVHKGSVGDHLYWDTGDPYKYVRLESARPYENFDVLIVGGADHKTGQPVTDYHEPFAELERWAREKYPHVQDVLYRWSGQVNEPEDHVAFIGQAPLGEKQQGLYVITGDSGQGMTHGTLGGMLVADQILGKPNPWGALYDPGRFKLTTDYVKENLNVAKEYLVDYLTPGEVKSVDDVKPGSGALMRSGLTKVAVYRDDLGQVHKCSAICTHLQCVVHWNDAEKSWDCPCHGSRFDPKGKVVQGPAVDDLAKS